jgi:hypothetical protein
MSKWVWFYDLIERKLANILSRYGFKQLTGKAYEVDENKDDYAFIMYASESGLKLSVDILTQYEIDRSMTFYLVRAEVPKANLKEWMYPNIRSQTQDSDLWVGWKCHNEGDVEQAIDEIAQGLERYLAENKPL